MEFLLSVADKHVTAEGSPVIVCGNSDYTIKFTFDTEWDGADIKTARFVFIQDGEVKYIDATFSGDTVAVPVLSNTRDVFVGVYAGDLRTTTPARIPCEKSILCGGGTHEDPPEDVYNQLVDQINKAVTKAGKAATAANKSATAAENSAASAAQSLDTATAVADEFDGLVHDAESLQALKTIIEQNKGKYLSMWIGTQAEYDALETVLSDCFYIVTDDPTVGDLTAAVEALQTQQDETSEKVGGMKTVLFEGDWAWGEQNDDILYTNLIEYDMLIAHVNWSGSNIVQIPLYHFLGFNGFVERYSHSKETAVPSSGTFTKVCIGLLRGDNDGAIFQNFMVLQGFAFTQETGTSNFVMLDWDNATIKKLVGYKF